MESLGALFKKAISKTNFDDQSDNDKKADSGERPRKKRKINDQEDATVLTADAPNLDKLEENLTGTLQDDEDEEENEELLGAIAAELSSEEKLGEKIDDKLADIINGRYQQKQPRGAENKV